MHITTVGQGGDNHMWFLDDAHEGHEEATSAVFAWIPAGVCHTRVLMLM